ERLVPEGGPGYEVMFADCSDGGPVDRVIVMPDNVEVTEEAIMLKVPYDDLTAHQHPSVASRLVPYPGTNTVGICVQYPVYNQPSSVTFGGVMAPPFGGAGT